MVIKTLPGHNPQNPRLPIHHVPSGTSDKRFSRTTAPNFMLSIRLAVVLELAAPIFTAKLCFQQPYWTDHQVKGSWPSPCSNKTLQKIVRKSACNVGNQLKTRRQTRLRRLWKCGAFRAFQNDDSTAFFHHHARRRIQRCCCCGGGGGGVFYTTGPTDPIGSNQEPRLHATIAILGSVSSAQLPFHARSISRKKGC